MKRSVIIQTNCKRCGKPIYTVNRSICGEGELKDRLWGICSACLTPEEKAEIMEALKKSLLG